VQRPPRPITRGKQVIGAADFCIQLPYWIAPHWTNAEVAPPGFWLPATAGLDPLLPVASGRLTALEFLSFN
jgi:hypothetical protein